MKNYQATFTTQSSEVVSKFLATLELDIIFLFISNLFIIVIITMTMLFKYQIQKLTQRSSGLSDNAFNLLFEAQTDY